MLEFDFVGDAVWCLAWRKFESANFKPEDMSGWHRNFRAQIVTSNNFMAAVARRLGLSSHTGDEKGFADALENMLGEIEMNEPGAGVERALEILNENVFVPRILNKVRQRVNNRKLHIYVDFTQPGESPDSFLTNNLRYTLGNLF